MPPLQRHRSEAAGRRLRLSGVLCGLSLASSTAVAGSLTATAPPVFTWTGFYGGQAGAYTFQGDRTPHPDGLLSSAFDAAGSAFSAASTPAAQPRSALGGGQVGFNYQVQALVFGLEGDLSYTGLDTASALAAASSNASLAFTSDVSSHWLSTMRTRIGIAPVDRLLIYTTGGLAVAQRTYNNGFAVVSPDGQDYTIGSASRMATGVALGGGLEYALTKNWTLKGEYLYADLGRVGNGIGPSSGAVPIAQGLRSSDLDEKVVRAAINYKFDWLSAPAAAFAK